MQLSQKVVTHVRNAFCGCNELSVLLDCISVMRLFLWQTFASFRSRGILGTPDGVTAYPVGVCQC